MRNLDSQIMAQLAASELRPFMLLDMEIDSTHYRYTDCDVPIVTGGNRFEPRGFTAEPIRYSMSRIVEEARFDLDNLDDALTAAFVGGAPQGGEVILYLALLDANYAVVASPVIQFQGELNAWNLDEEKVSVTVASLFTRWNQRTLAKHSASCRWKKFKGDECGYSGAATWCDRSYSRCAALNNTDNFGGFRWLPSIMDAEIWWGRTRSV